MAILVPITLYALIFGGILILREMAWADADEWRHGGSKESSHALPRPRTPSDLFRPTCLSSLCSDAYRGEMTRRR